MVGDGWERWLAIGRGDGYGVDGGCWVALGVGAVRAYGASHFVSGTNGGLPVAGTVAGTPSPRTTAAATSTTATATVILEPGIQTVVSQPIQRRIIRQQYYEVELRK